MNYFNCPILIMLSLKHNFLYKYQGYGPSNGKFLCANRSLVVIKLTNSYSLLIKCSFGTMKRELDGLE